MSKLRIGVRLRLVSHLNGMGIVVGGDFALGGTATAQRTFTTENE